MPNRSQRPPVRSARATALLEWLERSGATSLRPRTVLAPNPLVAQSITRLIEHERLSLVGVRVMTLNEVLNDLGAVELIHGRRRMGTLDALQRAHAALAPLTPTIADHPASLWAVAVGLRSQRNGIAPAREALLQQLPRRAQRAWSGSVQEFVSDLELVSTAPDTYWARFGTALWIAAPTEPLELRVAEALARISPTEVLTAPSAERWQYFETETPVEEAERIAELMAAAIAAGSSSMAVVVPSIGSEIAIAVEHAAAVRGIHLGGYLNARLADIPSLWTAFQELDLPASGTLSHQAGAAIFRKYAGTLANGPITRYGRALARAQRELEEAATLIMAIDAPTIPSAIVRATITQILDRWIESDRGTVQLLPLAQAADGMYHVVHIAGATADFYDTTPERAATARALLSDAGQATCSSAAASGWKNTPTARAHFTLGALPFEQTNNLTSGRALKRAARAPRDPEIEQRISAIDGTESSAWTGLIGSGSWLRERESPSALARYARCPFQYFLTTTLGLAGADNREGWQPSERGTVVHRILEHAVGSLDSPSTMEDLEAAVAQCAESEWERVLEDPTSAPPLARQRSEREWIDRSIEHFLRFEAEVRSEGFVHLIGTEYDLGEIDIPEVGMAGTGVADRVIATESRDAIRVIDYKTGKREHFVTDPEDITDKGEHLQLAMYGLALRSQFPNAEITCEYWFLGSDTAERVHYRIDEIAVDRTRSVLKTLTSGIRSGFFVPKPQPPRWPSVEWCSRCDVSAFCALRRTRTWAAARERPEDEIRAVVELIDREDGAE